jgi:hypothetical protein
MRSFSFGRERSREHWNAGERMERNLPEWLSVPETDDGDRDAGDETVAR